MFAPVLYMSWVWIDTETVVGLHHVVRNPDRRNLICIIGCRQTSPNKTQKTNITFVSDDKIICNDIGYFF